MDDAELVLAACGGDRDAFAQIYDRYSDRLFGFLCTVTRNREDAADALQDTFVLAATRLPQLRDPGKLRPWLFAVARHVALRGLGKASRQEPLEDLEVTDTAAGPAELTRQSELAELIDQAAAGLSPRDRVILDLHLRQGLEGKELGEVIGVGAGHADVLMSRLRDRVERALGALLVARMGRKDCPSLQAVLDDWDGRFTAPWRKRVARHVDRCEVCGKLRRSLVSPAQLLSALPLLAAPAAAKTKILEEVQLVSFGESVEAGRVRNQARKEGWGKDGFPPPMLPSRRRRGAAAVLAAAACLLLALTVPRYLERPVSGSPVEHPPEPGVIELTFNKDALQWWPATGKTPPEKAASGSGDPGAGYSITRTSTSTTTRPRPTTTTRPSGAADPGDPTTTTTRPSGTTTRPRPTTTTRPSGAADPGDPTTTKPPPGSRSRGFVAQTTTTRHHRSAP